MGAVYERAYVCVAAMDGKDSLLDSSREPFIDGYVVKLACPPKRPEQG